MLVIRTRAHTRFGNLRVINEDQVAPGKGFGQHSHSDMEIISYELSGELAHQDSMGNVKSIPPDDVRRMRADTGVTHNLGNAMQNQPDYSQHSSASANEPGQRVDSHAHHMPSMHDGHGARAPSLGRLTTDATIHCLIGCAIGEWIGLAIGVSNGLNTWSTMALATVLGFVGGYTLGLWPLVRQGMSWTRAFQTIWLGETISIAMMEFAMNFTDYHLGGLQAPSLLAPQFWLGYAAAVPVGFIAAWPVNYWLLKRNIKQHYH